MTSQLESRARVLTTFGAEAAVIAELLSYDADGFSGGRCQGDLRFPLDDEPFVETWRGYRDEVAASNLGVLADRLVQLHFPVQKGISDSEEYRAATRCGEAPAGMRSATGLCLARPAECTIVIHSTWAGAIPIIQVSCRDDFVSLVRALTKRNEPVPIPDSMGACIVAGYNNWDRFRRLRERWTLENPAEPFSVSRVAHLKERYQDRFILLSNGWYSDVPPGNLGLSDAKWRSVSLTIRREHECAHYWTRRVLSSMRNCILDEIIADYCGIVAACGRFRPDWLLTFLGLDDRRPCRENGRLHNYRGHPPLSDAAFAVMQRLVVAAGANLETFDGRHARESSGERGILLALLTLSQMSLEELASEDAPALMADAYHRVREESSVLVERDIRFLPRESGG